MLDLVALALVAVCFVFAVVYARFCDGLACARHSRRWRFMIIGSALMLARQFCGPH